MIGVADRRDEWVGPSSRPERLRASLRLEKANPQRERNGALHGVHAVVRFKKNLTPPTLSETGFINSCEVNTARPSEFSLLMSRQSLAKKYESIGRGLGCVFVPRIMRSQLASAG